MKTDERLPKLVDALPGANCGGCGFAGCQAYAQAVLDGRASVGQCGVGGAASAERMAQILRGRGRRAGAPGRHGEMPRQNHLQRAAMRHRTIAAARCSWPETATSACPTAASVSEPASRSALLARSPSWTAWRGSTRKMHRLCAVRRGLPAQGDRSVSRNADIVVACSNRERGARTREVCGIGCIGCHLCERLCEFDAIHVVENLAVIDYERCVSCGQCAAVCPRRLISDSNLRTDMDVVPPIQR